MYVVADVVEVVAYDVADVVEVVRCVRVSMSIKLNVPATNYVRFNFVFGPDFNFNKTMKQTIFMQPCQNFAVAPITAM
jgi:hypothetical protein